jgi:hypothetical protein
MTNKKFRFIFIFFCHYLFLILFFPSLRVFLYSLAVIYLARELRNKNLKNDITKLKNKKMVIRSLIATLH